MIEGVGSTPAYYNGTVYYSSAYSSTAETFTIQSDGQLSETSQTSIASFGYLPGSPTISANGTTNGIVWLTDRNTNELHAYNASTFATELWNSDQKAGDADSLGNVIKFTTPTVANGEVFVGTSGSLVVYGLTPPANAVPNPPTLSAAGLSNSSIQLTWTDTTPPPNTASGYLVKKSTDGVNFSQVATTPSNATSVVIGGLAPLTTYYFRIRGYNGLGDSSYSNVASATTTNEAVLNFSSGFEGTTSVLTYNGSAAINGTSAQLTNGGTYEAGSFFSNTPISISQFSTQFTFQTTQGTNTADGFTFCIQGNSPTALGPDGGGLGYGPAYSTGTGGIPNSAAVKFDLYSSQGEGPDSTGLYLDGASPHGNSIDLSSTLDLHSGNVFQVNMTYNGTTLSVTILNPSTDASLTQNYTVNIPAAVGANTAYLGFTGGNGDHDLHAGHSHLDLHAHHGHAAPRRTFRVGSRPGLGHHGQPCLD